MPTDREDYLRNARFRQLEYIPCQVHISDAGLARHGLTREAKGRFRTQLDVDRQKTVPFGTRREAVERFRTYPGD